MGLIAGDSLFNLVMFCIQTLSPLTVLKSSEENTNFFCGKFSLALVNFKDHKSFEDRVIFEMPHFQKFLLMLLLCHYYFVVELCERDTAELNVNQTNYACI